jgi:hypothetical protein
MFEKLPDPDLNPVRALLAYGIEQERLAREAATVYRNLEPLLADTAYCNQHFIAAGRLDLVMGNPAAMREIATPLELYTKGHNFAANMRFVNNHQPLTATQVRGLVNGTFQASYLPISHMYKPSFQRVLVLAPDFTSELVADVSAKDGLYTIDELQPVLPRLFVAYQAMSRLVDRYDPYVVEPDGMVDDLYLCH